jgi:hypothetical protein
VETAAKRINVTWTPAPPSPGCEFKGWSVYYRRKGTSEWSVLGGCTGLTNRVAQTSCIGTGLKCETTYRVIVVEECQNELANSCSNRLDVVTDSFDLCKARAEATTEKGLGACLTPAEAPGNVTAENVWEESADGALVDSFSKIKVTWDKGSQLDCVRTPQADRGFKGYKIEMSEAGAAWYGAGAGESIKGCEQVEDESPTVSCTAQGLESDTNYRFRVTQICTDTVVSSEPSTSSPVARTGFRAAPAPVVAAEIEHLRQAESAPVSWTVSDMSRRALARRVTFSVSRYAKHCNFGC